MENENVKRSPTSMYVEEQLWERVRIHAIKKKMTATEIVEIALQQYLKDKEE